MFQVTRQTNTPMTAELKRQLTSLLPYFLPLLLSFPLPPPASSPYPSLAPHPTLTPEGDGILVDLVAGSSVNSGAARRPAAYGLSLRP